VLWAGQPYSPRLASALASGLELPRATLLDASTMTKLLGDSIGAGLRILAPL
jgi:hypothetical protein